MGPLAAQSRISAALLVTAPLWMAACSEPAPPPPALPTPATDRMGPEAAARVQAWLRRVADAPEDPALLRSLAEICDGYGEWDAARQLYGSVAAIDPESPRAWYHLGRMRAEVGLVGEAVAAFRRTLELEPDYAPAHERLGSLLLSRDRLDEAEASFREAHRLAPNEPAGARGLARTLLQQDRPREAVGALEEALRARPDDELTRGLLARAWREAGEPEKAASFATAATDSHDVRVVDPWAAEVAKRKADYGAALRSARERLAGGDPAGAIGLLRPLLEEEPTNIVLIEIGVHAELARGDAPAAEALLARAAQEDAARVAANRALIAMRRGDANTALARIDEALGMDAQLGVAHRLRGELLAQLGRPAEAVASLRRADELGEGDARSAALEGVLLVRQGLAEEGIAAMQRATERYPEDPTTWINLASVLAQSRRTGEARRALDKARRIAPGHPVAERLGAKLDAIERATPPRR